MADNGASEKTEQPTHRRLSKSRSEGQVPFSQELPSALILLTMAVMLWMLGPDMLSYFKTELINGIFAERLVFETNQSFLKFAIDKFTNLIAILFPICMGIFVAGITGCVAVSGFNFAPSAFKLKLGNLNPVTGLGNLFSAQSIITLILSIFKLTFIITIVYFFIKNEISNLPQLRWASIPQILNILGALSFGIFIRVAAAILILAMADVFYQKWKYIKDLKMTRQEVQREHKEDTGSPELRRRIRTLQIEMANKRMLQEVPKANVILVNPTHVAVALKYDPKKMDSPILLAKGADNMCEKIKEIARAYGVPIIHRPELARSIFSTVEQGQPIPQALYVAVAEVLALIYRLRHRR